VMDSMGIDVSRPFILLPAGPNPMPCGAVARIQMVFPIVPVNDLAVPVENYVFLLRTYPPLAPLSSSPLAGSRGPTVDAPTTVVDSFPTMASAESN